jgi:hypothetical protein
VAKFNTVTHVGRHGAETCYSKGRQLVSAGTVSLASLDHVQMKTFALMNRCIGSVISTSFLLDHYAPVIPASMRRTSVGS